MNQSSLTPILLDAFIAAIESDTIIEVVRSGPTGISRGEKGLHL